MYYISLDTYGKYFLNMSVFIMYETMYYMYVYTVRTVVFLFIILYNYEDLNKGKKALKFYVTTDFIFVHHS